MVGSNTRMFLGPARGTAGTGGQQLSQQVGTFLRFATLSQCERGARCVSVWVSAVEDWAPLALAALTCFSRVADGGALPISVESRHTDGIGHVRNQVVQEGVANVSWNQNLVGKKEVG